MSHPQEIWNSYKELLKKSYQEEKFTAWRDLWASDGRLVVTFGKMGKDRFEAELHDGRDDITSFFSQAGGRIEIDFEDDGPVYQAQSRPNAFLVVSTFIATILESGYRYENRIVCHFTLDQHGRIKELVEYADPLRRQAFLKKLSG